MASIVTVYILGTVTLLKCMLDIHRIFSTGGEYQYILNDLYVTDYCVWLQGCSDELLWSVGNELEEVHIKKADLQLSLKELEIGGQLALAEAVNKDASSNESTQRTIETSSELLREIFQHVDRVSAQLPDSGLDSDDDETASEASSVDRQFIPIVDNRPDEQELEQLFQELYLREGHN
ncbi:unnamed protein product [Soboliphyme baturini]|uniref:Protein SHQ1 homolog n=1 Tax=Soboliphyme baturini TaxID=241478 RepID=A0A183ISP5_9BILA|nr:unnamed protein product [Soboliphyme baturini]